MTTFFCPTTLSPEFVLASPRVRLDKVCLDTGAMMKLWTLCALALLFFNGLAHASNEWGRNYFPNVVLQTHEGKNVRFFDDLIEGKVVVINFIYTTCPDVCPLETARLGEVYAILGDRVGKDIHFYSITIDPEVDTPEVLADYAKRYGARTGWTFLTGKERDITLLRRKLGLYIDEIQEEDSQDHNVNIVMGNQRTGRWMKRSPFGNPYVLAREIGDWLHNWKHEPRPGHDYADAPELRNLETGASLFRTRCSACHTVGNGDIATNAQHIGPDLFGVGERRDPKWLRRWLAEPDKMLEEKDPIAITLYESFNRVAMPNMSLNNKEIDSLLSYLESETRRVAASRETAPAVRADRKPDAVAACCQKGMNNTVDDSNRYADTSPVRVEATFDHQTPFLQFFFSSVGVFFALAAFLTCRFKN